MLGARVRRIQIGRRGKEFCRRALRQLKRENRQGARKIRRAPSEIRRRRARSRKGRDESRLHKNARRRLVLLGNGRHRQKRHPLHTHTRRRRAPARGSFRIRPRRIFHTPPQVGKGGKEGAGHPQRRHKNPQRLRPVRVQRRLRRRHVRENRGDGSGDFRLFYRAGGHAPRAKPDSGGRQVRHTDKGGADGGARHNSHGGIRNRRGGGRNGQSRRRKRDKMPLRQRDDRPARPHGHPRPAAHAQGRGGGR